MANKVVSITLTGSNSSAIRAISEVGAVSTGVAADSAAAFDKSTSKIGQSFTKLGNLGSQFGLPLTGALAGVGAALDKTSTQGANFGSTIAKVGGVELLAAGAGIALVGTSAVHAADAFETAHTQLQVAVKDTGEAFSQASPGVSTLDDHFVKLGFTTADTEGALARLTAATHNVADAEQLMSTAADLARARNIPLASAVDLLSKAQNGNYTSLLKLGIVGKAQTKQFHDMADVVDYLTAKFGGQAQAYAATFSGKLDALKASANQLEVELGQALIPKIEGLASGSVSAIQGFEHLNTSTDGVLGKVVALGAAVPVAVYAFGKLEQAGAAVVGAFAKVGSAIGNIGSTIGNLGSGGAAGSGIAEDANAAQVAEARLNVALNAQATAQAKVAAATEQYNTALATQAQAADGDVAANARLVAADNDLTASKSRLEVATANVATAQAAAGEDSAVAATGFSGAGVAMAGAALAAGGLYIAYKALTDQSNATKTATDNLTNAVIKDGQTIGVASASTVLAYVTAHSRARDVLNQEAISTQQLVLAVQHGGAAYSDITSRLSSFVHANEDGTEHQTGMADAAQKLLNNIEAQRTGFVNAEGNVSAYNKGVGSLHDTQLNATKSAGDLTGATNATTVAHNAATLAANEHTQAENIAANNAAHATYAYLGLAASIHTVADALNAINTAGFAPEAASISLDSAKTAQETAVQTLNAPPTTSSSGGGSSTTPTAAALDHEQKVLAVRDALRSEGDATTAVTAAQTSLTSARYADQTAITNLTTAQTNLRTVLKGVAADSLAATTATENYTTAQNAAAGGKLDVGDAKRALETAKTNQPLLQFAVTDASETLQTDQQSGASSEQLEKDQIALNDARIAASAGNEAVRRAELALSDARIASTQKTQAASDAQKTLNETLHGYPPNSVEAKTAQDALTQAQLAAQQAAEQVTSAQQSLVAAQDNITTSALNAQRAVADLNGQLTAAGGGSGGASKASSAINTYQTNLDDLITKTQGAIVAVGAADQATGVAFGQTILDQINALESYVGAEPILQAAFGQELQTLQTAYLNYITNQASKLPSSYGTSGGGNRTTNSNKINRASGGPVDGTDPTGIPINAHPGEWVIQKKAVDKYGPHAMAAINAGQLPQFAGGGAISPRLTASAIHGTIVNNYFTISAQNLDPGGSGPLIVEALRTETRRNGVLTGIRVG